MYAIAIDGPGGAGKSSVAKLLAKKLGILYVDTGALYRSIGLYMLRHSVDIAKEEDVLAALPGVKLKMRFTDHQVLTLNGEEIKDQIRTPEVSMAASRVSAIPKVREYLLDLQRDTAKKNSVVMDGRDIGTVILPNAELKIFLIASPEARAKRRFLELSEKGVKTTLEDVLAEMNERDKNDSTRATAPCVQAEDAILLDNSDLTLEETAETIENLLTERLADIKATRAYRRYHRTFAGLVRFLLHVHVTGKENVPKEGGLLVCANHIAIRDIFVIACVFPRDLRFLAKKELFSVPIIGRMIKKAGTVKVDRGANDVSAIRRSVELLKSGHVLTMFPQGHRNPGVNPAETVVKNGAALIANKSGATVLPVCIKVKNVKYGLFRRVDIVIGKPITNEELRTYERPEEKYRGETEKIFGDIVKLGGYDLLPPAKGENA